MSRLHEEFIFAALSIKFSPITEKYRAEFRSPARFGHAVEEFAPDTYVRDVYRTMQRRAFSMQNDHSLKWNIPPVFTMSAISNSAGDIVSQVYKAMSYSCEKTAVHVHEGTTLRTVHQMLQSKLSSESANKTTTG